MNARSKYTQNRIDYIVYGNPAGASRLLRKYRYTSPQDLHDRVAAVKELVQDQGKAAIRDLVMLHPDKAIVARLVRSDEDQFCGACGHSNYSGPGRSRPSLSSLDTATLDRRYQEALRQSNADPENPTLADEVQQIWGELQHRRREAPSAEPKEDEPSSLSLFGPKGFTVLGAVLVTGIVLGASLKSNA